MYYCFVCHEEGGVFRSCMKKLGMNDPGAVRAAAGGVGIAIPEGGPTGPAPREPLYEAVAAAADWFARQLRDSPEAQVARDYLASRHLELEVVLPLGLGYAPRSNALLDAMKALGVRDAVLLEAGLLVKREDGTLLPRLRGRLLFPIHDLRARVVAFGGRILGEGEPKYLNSPDSPVFHKGKLLYNLPVAKHAMRKAERAIRWKDISTCCACRSPASRKWWPRSAPASRPSRRSCSSVTRRTSPCCTTRTTPDCAPRSAPATSCCARACA